MMPIRTETRYFPPPDDVLPALVLQITELVDSYMLWIGPTDESQENAQRAPEKGNLCRDWACAMAPLPNTTSCAATSLCYSAASDFSQSMAQRLARKFKKQIFLSVDLPPTFISMGYGPQLALEVEKRLVETLKEIVAR